MCLELYKEEDVRDVVDEMLLLLVNNSSAYHMVGTKVINRMEAMQRRIFEDVLKYGGGMLREFCSTRRGDIKNPYQLLMASEDLQARVAKAWCKYYLIDEFIAAADLPRPTLRKVMDKSSPLLEKVTRVRGVELADADQDELTDMVKALRKEQDELKDLGIKSRKISGDINRLGKAIEAIIAELDDREPEEGDTPSA